MAILPPTADRDTFTFDFCEKKMKDFQSSDTNEGAEADGRREHRALFREPAASKRERWFTSSLQYNKFESTYGTVMKWALLVDYCTALLYSQYLL
jgi:hypothetical protein